MSNLQRIGLIGVGNMGMPLLNNLTKNNYEVNVLINKTKNLKKLKNYKVFSKNELNNFMKYNSTIISVLPNSKITKDLVSNISNTDKKKWMDLCSSCPNDVLEISNRLNKNNIEFIDAPVSGGPKGMRESNITTVASGPIDTYNSFYDIIKVYSSKIFYSSQNVGTSSSIKLANNTLLAMNLLSTAEVLNKLKSKNIDIEKALEFINNSSGKNSATQERYPEYILTEKYNFGFSYDLHKKDIVTFLNYVNPIDDRFLLSKVKKIYNDDMIKLCNVKKSKDIDHTEIVKVIS